MHFFANFSVFGCKKGSFYKKIQKFLKVAEFSRIWYCIIEVWKGGETMEIQKIAAEEEVLEALTRVLRREGSEEGARTADVLRAAELLGKHYSLFSDRVQGQMSVPLIICGEEELI